MKLTPLADNVLLKSFEAEEKTASGIILSTATKEKSVVSQVVAAGPGTEDVKMTVKARSSSSTARTMSSASSPIFWQLLTKTD